jgi:hypothetical protein
LIELTRIARMETNFHQSAFIVYFVIREIRRNL